MSDNYNEYYKSFKEELKKRKSEFPENFKSNKHSENQPNLNFSSPYKYYVEYTRGGYRNDDYKGFIVGIYLGSGNYKDILEELKLITDLPGDLIFLDTSKVGRIFFRLAGDITDKNNWDKYITWQIDKLKELIRIIKPLQLEKCVNSKSTSKINSNNKGSQQVSNTNQTQPLNQILYGPPGTGKTYNTINKALEVIYTCSESDIVEKIKDDTNISQELKDIEDERDRVKKVFEYYKEQGQIEFVTFHQSYGYEEFVEGIKADTNEKNEVVYIKEDGILKRLSVEALFEDLIFEDFQKDLNYSELYEILLTKFKKENYLLLHSKDNKKIEVREISNKDNLYCYHHDSDVRHTVGKERLKKLYDKYSSIQELNKVSGFHEEFTKVIGGANQTVYWTILNQLLVYKEELKKEETDENINYETKKELVKNNPKTDFKDNTKNYILIIDEINRGNISKIFGELITLIEDSKRLGKTEQVEITLPYSGEKFSVPQNLYIIGTMNTADRSIAPIDTALRRRFVFEEMAPNPSLLKDIKVKDGENETVIELNKLLEAINTRIEYLYDRDHTIGHAYLIDIKNLPDLIFAFKNKIIPLLAEYFYEDWENIDLVLNKNGMIEEEKANSDYLKNISKINGKKIYKVSDNNWNIKNFQKIYNDDALSQTDEQK